MLQGRRIEARRLQGACHKAALSRLSQFRQRQSLEHLVLRRVLSCARAHCKIDRANRIYNGHQLLGALQVHRGRA